MLHLHTFYKLMTISKASISPFFYNDTNYLFIVYQDAERGDSRTLLLLLICTEKYVLKHTYSTDCAKLYTFSGARLARLGAH